MQRSEEPMAIDTAEADYAQEQTRRAALADDCAHEWEMAVVSLRELVQCWGKPSILDVLKALPEKACPAEGISHSVIRPLREEDCSF